MKKILITGGMGYIGSILASHLHECGYSVTISKWHRDKPIEGFLNKFKVAEMDLLEEESINGICKDIDVVIHTATFDERIIPQRPRDALLANGYATRLLLDDAVKHGVKRFIYFSTFHVYGKSEGIISEETNVDPLSDYALTHYVAELYMSQYARYKGIESIILRLTNGIGAPIVKETDKWYLALNDFCKTVFEKQRIELKSTGLQPRDFVPIRDAAKAVELLVRYEFEKYNGSRVFNISSQESISIRELANKVSAVYSNRYNKKVELSIPDAEPGSANATPHLKVISERIRSLGWSPERTFEDEINEIFNLLDLE